MRVGISRVDPSLPLPTYVTDGATGFDFFARYAVIVPPRAVEFILTNAIVHVPDGHVLIVALRSGTPRRKQLLCPNGVGIIDQDYCGQADEIQVQVLNFSDEPVTVDRGERIAQGLLLPVERCEWVELPPARSDSRGGFGSTG
ncbi:MAG: dUTP diphosphatase [Chloroflexota bacterium]|nr:MAG: dUTP diphosphatase [Chloroflexota bacterium]